MLWFFNPSVCSHCSQPAPFAREPFLSLRDVSHTVGGITLFRGAFYGVRFAAFTYYSKQKILRLNRVLLRQFCLKITSLCVNPPDMPELIWGDTFSCIKIYHFEVLYSFVAIEFFMPKSGNGARLSPCEAFWQKHKRFLYENPILSYERSATTTGFLNDIQ